MKFIIFSILLVGFVSAVPVNITNYKACVSPLGKINEITVDPCVMNEKKVCQLTRGTNYTIGIVFTATAASKNVQTVIHGIVAGIPVPFTPDNPNACQASGLTCPLTTGKALSYHATLPIKSEYPAIELVVKWELTDTDANEDLACFVIPVAIISAHKDKVVSRHWYED